MSPRKKKETRPKSQPVPVRFSRTTLDEIDAVSELMGMSRQDVIRLSVSAGLKALRKIGVDGLVEKIAEEITAEPLDRAAEEPEVYRPKGK